MRIHFFRVASEDALLMMDYVEGRVTVTLENNIVVDCYIE